MPKSRRLPRFSRTVLLVLVPGVTVTGPLAGQEVIRNSAKECAICHVRWVDVVDRPGSHEPPMQTVLEREAGSGDMCLSCHDGSVVDSRFKVWSTSHHTTDSTPSPAVRIPTDTFPLDGQGRMTCATCHTAHAQANTADIRTVIFLRQPNIDSSLCLACHSEHAQKNAFQHPLGWMEAPVPEAILRAGGKTTGDGHTVICQTCHEPHGARNPWMLVLPPSQLCVTCHEGKAPEIQPAAGAPVHHIGRTYPGFQPPPTLVDQRAEFGPNGELSCLSCHRLHDASGAWPLLIRKNDKSALCLECHRQEESLLNSPHDLRVSAPEATNAIGQTAGVSGPCGACHRIHGWAREVQETHRSHSSGCMECHLEGGPGFYRRPYKESHPVGKPVPRDLDVPLPLDPTTRAIGCLTCHDPHTPRRSELTSRKDGTREADRAPQVASERVPETLAPPEIGYPLPAPRSFLRREGSQLCVLCHGAKAVSLRGPHDPVRFASTTCQSLGVHPSVGSCRVCHTTHDAQGPHLWALTPSAFSSPGTRSDLCDACHDGEGVASPRETHHPQSVVPSAHGRTPSSTDPAKVERGHATEEGCGVCHDPHGGSSPVAQLRRPLETLCTGCHSAKEGIRHSIHDPSTATWAGTLGGVSQGLCLDCHPIHEPAGKGRLWEALGAGQDPNTLLCERCHRDNAMAKAVTTPHLGRPVSLVPHLPEEGSLPGSSHRIRCTTCHDIHQKEQGTMLLRMARPDSSLCLGCHAEAKGLIDTLHDLRRSLPGTINRRGETAGESGPCGACHVIHPTGQTPGGWAFGPAPQADFGLGLCTGCHRPEGCAGTRIPAYADHPSVSLFNRWAPPSQESMPTFDIQGHRSRTGAITCRTCHDPHTRAPSDGRMFLRPFTRPQLCIDCHGIEAIWRFLYFHRTQRTLDSHAGDRMN